MSNVTTFEPRTRLDLSFPEVSGERMSAYMAEVEPVLVNFLDGTFEGDPKTDEGKTLAGLVLLGQTMGFAIAVEVQRLPTAERESAIFQIGHTLLANVIADAASSSAARINNGGV